MSKRGESAMSGEKKKSKKRSKKRPIEMRLRHAASGGYIAKHSFKPGPGEAAPEDEEHAIPDLDSLHDHIDNHFSAPPKPQAPAMPSPLAGAGAEMQ